MGLDALRQHQGCLQAPDKPLLLQLLILGIFSRGLVFESQSAAMGNSSAQLARMPLSALKGLLQLHRDVQHLLQERAHATRASSVLLIEEPDWASSMHADGHRAARLQRLEPLPASRHIVQCWDMSSSTEKCII